MTSKKEGGVREKNEHKTTVFITADLVLSFYSASEKEKDKAKKKELLDQAIFLSQHLNTHIPLLKSEYTI
jgi:hypothetical protein